MALLQTETGVYNLQTQTQMINFLHNIINLNQCSRLPWWYSIFDTTFDGNYLNDLINNFKTKAAAMLDSRFIVFGCLQLKYKFD